MSLIDSGLNPTTFLNAKVYAEFACIEFKPEKRPRTPEIKYSCVE